MARAAPQGISGRTDTGSKAPWQFSPSGGPRDDHPPDPRQGCPHSSRTRMVGGPPTRSRRTTIRPGPSGRVVPVAWEAGGPPGPSVAWEDMRGPPRPDPARWASHARAGRRSILAYFRSLLGPVPPSPCPRPRPSSQAITAYFRPLSPIGCPLHNECPPTAPHGADYCPLRCSCICPPIALFAPPQQTAAVLLALNRPISSRAHARPARPVRGRISPSP